MLFAQLTDCHILPPGRLLFGAVDTAARLAQAVRHLNNLRPRPDLVILTGDLTDGAEAAAYRHARDLLAPLRMPLHIIPGNHDDRDGLRAAFGDHGYLPDGEFLHYAIDHGPLRLIGLDTTVPGQAHGAFDAPRAAWLDATLQARPGVPTILFMHHPPFLTGDEALDTIGCHGADRLGAVLAEHRHVEAILCGHHHQAINTRWRGITASVAPATAHQMIVDLSGETPPTRSLEPAQAALHLWRRGAGLVSRVICVEPFPVPPRQIAAPAETWLEAV
jgi:3',5'-cyclic AMP phosphodiesterase CpdA